MTLKVLLYLLVTTVRGDKPKSKEKSADGRITEEYLEKISADQDLKETNDMRCCLQCVEMRKSRYRSIGASPSCRGFAYVISWTALIQYLDIRVASSVANFRLILFSENNQNCAIQDWVSDSDQVLKRTPEPVKVHRLAEYAKLNTPIVPGQSQVMKEKETEQKKIDTNKINPITKTEIADIMKDQPVTFEYLYVDTEGIHIAVKLKTTGDLFTYFFKVLPCDTIKRRRKSFFEREEILKARKVRYTAFASKHKSGTNEYFTELDREKIIDLLGNQQCLFRGIAETGGTSLDRGKLEVDGNTKAGLTKGPTAGATPLK